MAAIRVNLTSNSIEGWRETTFINTGDQPVQVEVMEGGRISLAFEIPPGESREVVGGPETLQKQRKEPILCSLPNPGSG